MSTLERHVLQTLAESIDIPASAYQKAAGRYADLGSWFSRPESRVVQYDPHIYSQGSFRLGTIVRPINPANEYDLDVGCRLRRGATHFNVSQQDLKVLVGSELRDYRQARQIVSPLDDLRRCWRLSYKDELPFHMDVVPSIPEALGARSLIAEAMARNGIDSSLSVQLAEGTGSITDTGHPRYRIITPDWYVSNSTGYATWFESRMRLAPAVLQASANRAGKAKIDDLPSNLWKSPLQASVQILKRHRDMMFADDANGAPISVIITTLAAWAYQGEATVADALRTISANMRKYVREHRPRIPNPVNPAEDFADKWHDPQYGHEGLEFHFWRWIAQVETDVASIVKGTDPSQIVAHAGKSFGVTLDRATVAAAMTGGGLLSAAATPGGLTFPSHPVTPKNPAGFA